MDYLEGLVILICINLLAVLGVSLLTGFTGIFSFGHAAYMAIGAYTASILVVKLHVPFVLALAGSAITATLASLIIGWPTMKLVGDYFAIAALGFGEAVRLLMDNGGNLTGGARGMPGIPADTTFWVALIAAVLGIVLIRNILISRYGRAFVAIREDNLAAEAVGINTNRMKMLSLAISAAYTGISGGLWAHYMTFIQPVMFDMNKSTELAATVVFGGLGSITGSIVATIVLVSIPEVFRFFLQWRMVFYGLALVATITLRPEGIMGYQELSWDWLKGVATRGVGLFRRKEASHG